jgi:hypothetical protein
MGSDGYIIEYRKVGNSVKVSAIDTVSMTEVSVIASPRMSRKNMADLAIKKLLYVLGKK